jgi:hypothetical protein
MATTTETKTPKISFGMAHEMGTRYMAEGYNIMFTGMPGIGKTALVELICEREGWNVIVFHPVISDPVDFKGMPWLFTDSNGKEHCVFVPFDQLKALVEAKGKTIVFLDDLGQAPEAVQAACMQLLHGGKINGVKISDDCSFVACTNRKRDRAGVKGILEPVKSRFHGIWELEPDLDLWLDYMIGKGMSPMLVAFMRKRPAWLTGGDDGWKPESDIVNQPCPRTLEHLSDAINLNLPKVARPTAYAGAVGQSLANEYFAWEQLLLQMPDLDVVCQNPGGAEVPTTPDIMYAMIGALHVRMDHNNISNIYKYIERVFPQELQAVFYFDVKKFNPALINTRAHVAWAANHGDILSN